MKKLAIVVIAFFMPCLTCVYADLNSDADNNIKKRYADRHGGTLPPKDAYSLNMNSGKVSVAWNPASDKMDEPYPGDDIINAETGAVWYFQREADEASPNKGWDNLSHEMRFQLKVFYNFDKRLRVREGKPEITFPEFLELMRPVWNAAKPPE